MKNHITKYVLIAAVALLMNGAGANATTKDKKERASRMTRSEKKHSVRTVQGILTVMNATMWRQINSDNIFVAYHVDTDYDGMPDVIKYRAFAPDAPIYHYAPGTHVRLTERRDKNGKWLISDIEKLPRVTPNGLRQKTR